MLAYRCAECLLTSRLIAFLHDDRIVLGEIPHLAVEYLTVGAVYQGFSLSFPYRAAIYHAGAALVSLPRSSQSAPAKGLWFSLASALPMAQRPIPA
jgi:hypothetical protein